MVGSEACFEWLGSCSKLKRGPLAVTNFRLSCPCLGLVMDQEDNLHKVQYFRDTIKSKTNTESVTLAPCLSASRKVRPRETAITASRLDSTIMTQRLCMCVTFGLTQSFSLQPIVIRLLPGSLPDLKTIQFISKQRMQRRMHAFCSKLLIGSKRELGSFRLVRQAVRHVHCVLAFVRAG